MTNEETLKGNKLIAEFMAIKNSDGSIYQNIEGGCPLGTMHFNTYALPVNHLFPLTHHFFNHYGDWHSSWDWLIPVIQKIAELKYPISLYFSHIQNTTSIHRVNNPYYLVRKSETRRTTPAIEVAYKAVIEFIDEYNKSTQHV